MSAAASKPTRELGRGRTLIAIYAFLALAACARSSMQVATRLEQAPAAFLLSGVSGAIYLLAAVSLPRDGRGWWAIGTTCCGVELVGVVTVGAWSLASPATFPEPTVWSQFGSGYGYLPLVLPVLGLLWQLPRG